MSNAVEITFDCLPLRSIGRMDVPIDASPGYVAQCQRIRDAIEKHGSHNSYYLYRARCIYRLVNHAEKGRIEFKFEGAALTNADDSGTEQCDLQVELDYESCDWLTDPVLEWFKLSVAHSVAVEFDRYIDAGDLDQARARVEKIRAESDESGGFLGMYL